MKLNKVASGMTCANFSSIAPLTEQTCSFSITDAAIYMCDAKAMISDIITNRKRLSKTDILRYLNELDQIVDNAQLSFANGNRGAVWQTVEYPSDDLDDCMLEDFDS